MNLAVVGAQWGDEGKGKMVDYFSDEAELVIRFSGGANAGHTVRIGSKTFALHLIPAGIISRDKSVVLGNGMVIDPASMFEELAVIRGQGIEWEGRVFVSDRAHLVFPGYKSEDQSVDDMRSRPIGTTGRGIGVAYGKKASRDGIRIADLWDPVIWDSMSSSERAWMSPFREWLAPMKLNLAAFMMENEGRRTLLEGAQGTLLDLDHGTYPYVSSGISVSSGAAIGAAIGPRKIDKCLGVFKAYQTRVGNGPFPTEMKEDAALANRLRELGHEYGVTTGRPRRIGYLDLVALKYAGWINSLDGFILSHLNLYDGFESVGLCTAYELDGQQIDYFPSSAAELERVIPLIEKFDGWDGRVSETRDWEELPVGAKRLVEFIEEYTGVGIHGFSVGPLRSETFMRADTWTVS